MMSYFAGVRGLCSTLRGGGEGGLPTELQSFYTAIVAVIIGVDRLLYLFVILIPLKCSVQN